ncbi:DUF6640 family protein [Amycolatopsis sp. NPDC101161]|uniref:DUF6640 family protein n=1 Tax=Amycolatopsis sp. NPDC101161 TaxID=3363940 RepID=UPI0038048D2C
MSTRVSTGKVLLTLSAVWSACGSYRFDWNETHIHNPDWPPHAKFHNAQTMSTGAVLGAAATYLLWVRRGPWTKARLQVATAAASVYWVTQLSATLYPGTALFDRARPATGETEPPRWRGPQTVVAGAALAVNTLSYALERRQLGS